MPKSLRTLTVVLTALCALSFSVHAEDADESFRRGKALIAQGYTHSDPAPLEEAKTLFVELANQSELEVDARYFAGLAYYRLFEISVRRGDRKARYEIFIDHALNQLKASLKHDDTHAPSHALLAICLARKVSRYPLSIDHVRPQILEMVDKARQLAPDDPRVKLLVGYGMHLVPEVFESEPSEALALLREALEGFEGAPPAGPRDAEWGHAETLAWIGQVHMSRGDKRDARKSYEKALKVDADYDWVKNELLPRLSQKAQGGAR